MKMDNHKPIFIYNNGLAFMENGGRYVIMKPNGYFTDFGSGKQDNQPRIKTEWVHDKLGRICAEGSTMIFYDYNSYIDFDELKNANFINRRRIKPKPPYHVLFPHEGIYELYHMLRFVRKHHNKFKNLNNI